MNLTELKRDIRVAWSVERLQGADSAYFLSHGLSMKPFFRKGDLVTIAPTGPKPLRIGEIILARSVHSPSGLLMHRVIRKPFRNGDVLWWTQGDAVPYPDPPIQHHDILGKVIGIKRNGREIRFDRGVYYWLGWVLGHLAFLTRRINRIRLWR